MEIELLARARENGAEVVLTGAGADELFDGEPRSLASLVTMQGWRRAARQARGLEGFGRPRSPIFEWLVRPLVAARLPRGIRRLRAHASSSPPPWAGPRLRAHYRAWSRVEMERTFAWDVAGPEARATLFLSSSHRRHVSWLKHQEERAAGIVRCDPYTDPEVVSFVLGLPEVWLIHGGLRRGLFREVIRDLVPEGLRMRNDKAHFEPAFARFLRAADGVRTIEDLADFRELAALELVDPAKARSVVRGLVAEPETTEGWSTLWPALAVEAFLRARENARA